MDFCSSIRIRFQAEYASNIRYRTLGIKPKKVKKRKRLTVPVAVFTAGAAVSLPGSVCCFVSRCGWPKNYNIINSTNIPFHFDTSKHTYVCNQQPYSRLSVRERRNGEKAVAITVAVSFVSQLKHAAHYEFFSRKQAMFELIERGKYLKIHAVRV